MVMSCYSKLELFIADYVYVCVKIFNAWKVIAAVSLK